MMTLTALIASVTGNASANELTLKGMNFVDGNFIKEMFWGISITISVIGGLIWKLRRDLNREVGSRVPRDRSDAAPDPTTTIKVKRPIDSDDVYVTHGECKAHRCAIEKRIDAILPSLERIEQKLTENDRNDEQRIKSVHARIDPLIESVAANKAEVAMLKDFARSSTVGGKKD